MGMMVRIKKMVFASLTGQSGDCWTYRPENGRDRL
jgi:hypothetical protein